MKNVFSSTGHKIYSLVYTSIHKYTATRSEFKTNIVYSELYLIGKIRFYIDNVCASLINYMFDLVFLSKYLKAPKPKGVAKLRS